MTTYASAAELKTWLEITTAAQDNNLTIALNAADAKINQYCNRSFAAPGSASPRYYWAPSVQTAQLRPAAIQLGQAFSHAWNVTRRDLLNVDDFASTSGLLVATDDVGDGTYSTAWAASDFTTYPLNLLNGEPYKALLPITKSWPVSFDGRPTIKITAAWGWTAVPSEVKQAELILAARYFKRHQSPTGVEGWSGDAGVIRVSTRMDPDVVALLSPYKKIVFA